ncbi:DUF4124 domain-containing protein [Bermanella sp. WJH001]|uniref:DUF4124 domain-containing protein n=1 Tax=Bermanella sp. WJH001 TaxID=3048005 RepID=UPI0024BEF246|nr:DUF4124 domain-containing protein [Bermanella sp. WJH001]MDJ1537838.1 DUF4124 domain-containing protein [Bermanella sp. WJH001]
MRVITSLFTLFLLASAHAGQVYKWTDENGQTHFSQFPPATAPAENIEVNAPKAANSKQATEQLQKMRQQLQEQVVDRTTESEEEKQAAEEAQRMAENCKKAKQRLTDLKNNGRIYRTLENGEREWYDEKGRENLIKDAQKDVTKYCSK